MSSSSACRSPSDCRPPSMCTLAGIGYAHAVGLVGVVERDLRARRLLRDDVERDADRLAVVEAGAEVGMQSDRGADRLDHLRGVRGDRQSVDALVPRVRRGEDRALRCGRQSKCVRRGNADQHRAGGKRENSLHGTRVPEAGGRAASPYAGGAQRDGHVRALAFAAREGDRAAVLLDQRTRDRKPKPGARNRVPGRSRGAEEAREDLAVLLARDADARCRRP